MANEIASVSLTPQAFPPGTVPGPVVFTLLDNNGKVVQTQSVDAGIADTVDAASLLNIPDGVGYTVTAARLDGAGNVLGPISVSSPFNEGNPVIITVPTGAVTVAPPAPPPPPPPAAKLTIDYGAGFSTGQENLAVTGNGVFANAPNMTLSPANVVHSGAVVYFNQQQDISKFKTIFFFKMPNALAGAVTAALSIIFQNSTSTTNPQGFGTKATGDANGAGYLVFEKVGSQTPPLNSAAVYFDIGATGQGCYPVTAKGNFNTMGLAINGGTDLSQGIVPTNDLNPSGIDLHSGNLFCCTLTYDGETLTAVLKNVIVGNQFRISWPVNLPACIGSNMAFVGFGGGNVAVPSGQEIDVTSWQFFEGNDPALTAPTFSVTPGQYQVAQTVSLSAAQGASIFYTVNGLPPTTASTLYTGPITVSSNQYVQAVAVKAGCMDSPVSVASYQIGTPNHINLGSGFSPGDGMIVCGNAVRSGSKIQLVDTVHNGETGATWWGAPVPVEKFSTTFSVTFANAQANGVCFVLQQFNPHADVGYNGTYGSGQLHVSGGPTAMGNNQNGMGYGSFEQGNGFVGIYNSIAIAFDFFTVANSVGLYLDGVEPAGNQIPITGLDITKGHEIIGTVAYDGNVLTLTLSDFVTGGTFTHSWAVDIVGEVGGNTAYAGFTAGTGGATVNAFLNHWQF